MKSRSLTVFLAGILFVIAAVFSGGAAHAQATGFFQGPTGFEAGSILLRGRVDGVVPQNFSSSVNLAGSNALAGSQVHTSNYVIPELDLSYFFTPHIAVEAIAGISRHNIWATTPIGTVKVGSTWVVPPIITVQYHFAQIGGFTPYVGAGVSALFFFNTHHAADIDSVHLNSSVGPAIEAGFDYHLSGSWYANFVVKQSFANTQASIDHGAIHAETALAPTVIGAGIGYQF